MSGSPESLRRRAREYVRAHPQAMNGHQIAVFLVTGALLALGALVGVSWVAGFRQCWHALRDARWTPLVLAPAAVLVSHIGYTISYRAVARVADGPNLGTRDATALVVAGFGPFNPRGGFTVDSHAFSERRFGRERATLRVLVLGVLEYAVLAPIAWGASLWMLAAHHRDQADLLVSWVVGVPAGGLLTLGAWLVYRHFRSRTRAVREDARVFRAIGIALRMMVTAPGGTLAWVGMSLYWAGEIALLGICMAVFAPYHWSVAAMAVAYATGYAFTRRTMPLAGAGPVEVIMPFALVWLGNPLSTAVVAVAVYRVFNLWLTIPPSTLALRRLRRIPDRMTPEERMEPSGPFGPDVWPQRAAG